MTDVCEETRKRVRLTVAAYAYEFGLPPIMTDAEFDALARSVDLSVTTRLPAMDDWWRANFTPDTGMWVNDHPELIQAAEAYRRLTGHK